MIVYPAYLYYFRGNSRLSSYCASQSRGRLKNGGYLALCNRCGVEHTVMGIGSEYGFKGQLS
jgi:hypothetical protein